MEELSGHDLVCANERCRRTLAVSFVSRLLLRASHPTIKDISWISVFVLRASVLCDRSCDNFARTQGWEEICVFAGSPAAILTAVLLLCEKRSLWFILKMPMATYSGLLHVSFKREQTMPK